VIACSGQGLLRTCQGAAERKNADVAIMRVEHSIVPAQGRSRRDEEVPERDLGRWCQTSRRTMAPGSSWQHYSTKPGDCQNLLRGRPASASPAVGYAHVFIFKINTERTSVFRVHIVGEVCCGEETWGGEVGIRGFNLISGES